MSNDPQNPRKGKRLLVASIGVATVSFLSLQTGCEDGQMTNVANLLTPPVDTFHDPSHVPDAALDAASDALIPSANLLAPPGDAAFDAIVPTGNLLAPPDASLHDAALDAIVTSGNLLPPPDAAADAAPAKDAAPAHDAKVDTGLPTSGNLLPPMGPR
jgi:hypothetical protein